MQVSGQSQVRDLGAVQAARHIVERSAAILLDWDGCVATGNQPHADAVRFIAEHPGRVAVVSNNSTHLPQDFAAILAASGVLLPQERIVLAGTQALIRAQEIGARGVLVLGNARMKAFGRNLGLNLVSDEADLVVVLRDTRFSYARLERAANSLRRGARLLVANPDLTHPAPGGRLAPETGALLAAVLACMNGVPVDVETVGKPAPRLFRKALAAFPQGSGGVMIGDNPQTDMEGARAAGLEGVLIGPQSGIGFGDLL